MLQIFPRRLRAFVRSFSFAFMPFVSLCFLAFANSTAAQTPPAPTWVARWDDRSHSGDLPHAVATDPQGNVYVTGSECFLNSDPNVACPEGKGGVIEMLTIKYNASGVRQWTASLGDTGWQPVPGTVAVGTANATDAASNVYVAGYRTGSDAAHGDQIFVAKYNSAGQRQWFGGYMNQQLGRVLGAISDFSVVPGKPGPISVLVDAQGNVFISSFLSDGISTATTGPLTTLKFSSTGEMLWVRTWVDDNSASNANVPTDMHLDPSGNVYIAGFSAVKSDFGKSDAGVELKYDTNGNLLWFTRIDGAAALTNAVDSTGASYLSGYIGDVSQPGTFIAGAGMFIYKIPSTGNGFLWQTLHQTPSATADFPAAMVIDGRGFSYVVASATFGTSGSSIISTLVFADNGAFDGEDPYNYFDFRHDEAVAIKIDASGKNVYVTGSSMGSATPFTDFVTIKYTIFPSGAFQRQWAVLYDGPGGQDDKPSGLALSGNALYVTGLSGNVGTNVDWATVRYPQ